MSANTKQSKQPKAQPEKKIGPFASGLGATIWLNKIETGESTRFARSITINPRRYFDPESKQWKDAPSFNPSDLPALIFALTKAQEYCYETPVPGTETESNENGEGSGGETPF